MVLLDHFAPLVHQLVAAHQDTALAVAGQPFVHDLQDPVNGVPVEDRALEAPVLDAQQGDRRGFEDARRVTRPVRMLKPSAPWAILCPNWLSEPNTASVWIGL